MTLAAPSSNHFSTFLPLMPKVSYVQPGRNMGLESLHLLSNEDTRGQCQIFSLWPFLCSVNYLHTFLSTVELQLIYLCASTAIFPHSVLQQQEWICEHLSWPQSAYLCHPRGRKLPIDLCTFLFYYKLISVTHQCDFLIAFMEQVSS